MAKRKDPTIKALEELLRQERQDVRVWGRTDYRRGYIDALRQAIDIRKEILQAVAEA